MKEGLGEGATRGNIKKGRVGGGWGDLRWGGHEIGRAIG